MKSETKIVCCYKLLISFCLNTGSQLRTSFLMHTATCTVNSVGQTPRAGEPTCLCQDECCLSGSDLKGPRRAAQRAQTGSSSILC